MGNPAKSPIPSEHSSNPPAQGATVHPIEDKLTPEQKAAAELAKRRAEASERIKEAVKRLNETYAMVIISGTAAIIDTSNDERLELWQKGAFLDYYANETIGIVDSKGRDRQVSIASLWLRNKERRTYRRVVFEPGRDTPKDVLNLWTGWEIEAKKDAGSWATLREHILVNICNSDQKTYRWVMMWLAHAVQRPWEKPESSLVLRGLPGTGKSTIGDVMARIMGRYRVLAPNSRYITGQFNSHLETAIILQAEEAVFGGDRAAANQLKDLITNPLMQIERKGKEPITVRSCVRLLVTTNEGWPVPIQMKDRRITLLDVGDRNMQDKVFFALMWAQLLSGGLEAFFYHLKHEVEVDINVLREPIQTAARTDVMVKTLDSTHTWWLDCLEDARVAQTQESAHVAVDDAYDAYIAHCTRVRERYPISKAQLGTFLAGACPDLSKERPRRSDGTRYQRYTLPSLPVCRAKMLELMGVPSYDWPDSDDWLGEPTAEEKARKAAEVEALISAHEEERRRRAEAEKPMRFDDLDDEPMPF